jgi:excisionase family DNA binding protein
MMMTDLKFMNYEQAADFIGVTIGTLYSMVARRAIPHHRIGPRLVRFSGEELRAWLERKAVADHREGGHSGEVA